MSERIRFESVLNPDKYGFIYESSATENWNLCYNRPGIFSYQSFYFETYGDKGVQHSGLANIPANNELTVDWLLSLAKHLLDNPGAYNYTLESFFGSHGLTQERVKFLDGIKEGQGYYSLQECKTSKAGSKQYDKRWHAIPSRAFLFSYRIERLSELYFTAESGRQFTFAERIGALLHISKGLGDCGISLAAAETFSGWLSEDVLTASKALFQAIESIREMDCAKRCVDCHIGNIQRAASLTQAA
jgi:hypothetical protein